MDTTWRRCGKNVGILWGKNHRSCGWGARIEGTIQRKKERTPWWGETMRRAVRLKMKNSESRSKPEQPKIAWDM